MLKKKISQLYSLFQSRLKHIIKHKLLHYFPLVFIVFIFSSILSVFGIHTIRMEKSSISKYQNSLNNILRSINN